MDLNKQPETSTSARMTEKLKEENKYLRENLKEKKESINKHFREKKVFEEIKKVDQGIVKQKDFISEDECKELLEYLRNLKNKSVGKSGFIEREEKSMIFFIIALVWIFCKFSVE